MIRNLLRRLLERAGYEIECYADAADAVAACIEANDKGQPFDAMNLDNVIASGTGGRETIQRILAVDPNATVRVSSGYVNDPVMANFMDHGFRGVVSKPYKVDELPSALAGDLRQET